MSLEVSHVSYVYRNRYQSVQAVKDVSYAFAYGKLTALVGKSGSGKTTLLSLLAGLDLPTEGEVLYNGTPTAKLDLDAYRRQDAAVIYQSYNLFPKLTVLENAMVPLLLQKKSKQEAQEAAARRLAEVGIGEDMFKRYPNMLSGGEQQRVAIARALVNRPAVLFADEPSGNLDSVTKSEIHNLFFRLRDELGQTIVIVTHDPELAKMCDRTLFMKDGQFLSAE
ncbi:MAG: ABC transporter ATP-binding protein [Eubacteriales bacterium]|nr:ABC transporter ATP-binding protein [Eubacteriales bacterium]